MDIGIKDLINQDNCFSIGVEQIDKNVRALRLGELTTIVADNRQARTYFILHVIGHLIKEYNIPVVYISGDEKSDVIKKMLVCQNTKIHPDRLRSGRMAPHEWAEVDSFIEKLKEWPLDIEDAKNMDLASLWMDIRTKSRLGKKVIIIDSWESIQDGMKVRRDDRSLSSIVYEMKMLARDLNCAIVVTSMSDDECKFGTAYPVLSMARDTALVENSDKLFIMTYPESRKIFSNERGEDLRNLLYVNLYDSLTPGPDCAELNINKYTGEIKNYEQRNTFDIVNIAFDTNPIRQVPSLDFDSMSKVYAGDDRPEAESPEFTDKANDIMLVSSGTGSQEDGHKYKFSQSNEIFALYVAHLAVGKYRNKSIVDFVHELLAEHPYLNTEKDSEKKYIDAIYDLSQKNKKKITVIHDQGTMQRYIEGCYSYPRGKKSTSMKSLADKYFLDLKGNDSSDLPF